jgi:histidinol-phosphatase (PHP family)
MSIPCDYHMHSRFSSDGQATIPEMCEAAIRAGLREICLTEHVDWIPWDKTRDFFNPAAYVPVALEYKNRYEGRLTIRVGLEISEPHLVSDQIKILLASWPIDFVLGSAHWIDQSGVYFTELYQVHSVDEIEREYFKRVLELVRDGEFDSLGHLDLVKRYRPIELGPFDAAPHREIIHEILRILVSRDKAFEVNTSPLRRGLDSTCPGLEVLKWYRDLGGEKLTIGSDAHNPEQIATGFDTALEMLRAAGFKRIVRFERRQPELIEV